MRSLDAPDTHPVGDTATRSLQICTVRGGVKTGHRLRTAISDRFTALWQRNRRELTVEALVRQSTWNHFFFGRGATGCAPRMFRSSVPFGCE